MEVNNKTAPVTGQQDQNTISLDLMNRMKLHGMAEAFRESLCSLHANGTIVRRLPLHGLPRMRHSVTRPILNRLTMPRTGGWTATRWNVSPPLILCIRHRTFSLPVLQERGKVSGLRPRPQSMQKGIPYLLCQCPETARSAESRQSQRYT